MTIVLLLIGARNTSHAQDDLLLILPLDTTVVTLDSSVSVAALADDKTPRRNVPSPATLVAKAFHPVFGDAIAHAARRIEVIDSSASTDSLSHAAAASENTFPRDVDSSRYVLTLKSLMFTQSTRTVARRTVPPSPPMFDPTTGTTTPGVRRAYSEGPGRLTTLTATASWRIWDHAGDSVFAAGEARGSAEFRGDARRADWEKTARALALDILRRTPYSPGTPAPESRP